MMRHLKDLFSCTKIHHSNCYQYLLNLELSIVRVKSEMSKNLGSESHLHPFLSKLPTRMGRIRTEKKALKILQARKWNAINSKNIITTIRKSGKKNYKSSTM
jgi:hypothetical protein